MPFFRVKPSYVYIDFLKGTRVVRKAYHEGEVVELSDIDVGGQSERLIPVSESEMNAIKAKLEAPAQSEKKVSEEEPSSASPAQSKASAIKKLQGAQAEKEPSTDLF